MLHLIVVLFLEGLLHGHDEALGNGFVMLREDAFFGMGLSHTLQEGSDVLHVFKLNHYSTDTSH